MNTNNQDMQPQNLIAKANHMRKNMDELEKSLSNTTLLEKHKGIQIHITGDNRITRITFDPDIQNLPLNDYSDEIINAINKAIHTCERNRQNHLLNIISQIDERTT